MEVQGGGKWIGVMRWFFNSLGNNSTYKEETRSYQILSILAFGHSGLFFELLYRLLDRGVFVRTGVISEVHFGGYRLERQAFLFTIGLHGRGLGREQKRRDG